jgi:hypothetical protein
VVKLRMFRVGTRRPTVSRTEGQCVVPLKLKLNSVALVRERTMPTERPPLVGEVWNGVHSAS